jgi:hypothetical protein
MRPAGMLCELILQCVQRWNADLSVRMHGQPAWACGLSLRCMHAAHEYTGMHSKLTRLLMPALPAVHAACMHAGVHFALTGLLMPF